MAINWLQILDHTERGVRSSLANAVKVLQHDPTLGPTAIWYDEFLDRIFHANSPAREWRDEDDYRLTVHMQEACMMPTIADHLVGRAVRMVAKQRTRHIVRDWLASLTWDGTDRLAHALEDFWGVDLTPQQPADYVRAASTNFFIGMVARIFQPGCQFDTMLVLEGGQGIGKTTSLRVLGGDHYMLAHESVTQKDFFQALAGKWLIEIGEMDAFSRADERRVKTVISTPTDRYRGSYDRYARDHARQCAFVGTTNKDDWATDETGLRRYWPVKCGVVNLKALAAARDQLFAEAVRRFKAGATWWEMPASTIEVQAERQGQHPWTDAVLAYVALLPSDDVSLADVLVAGLKKDLDTLTMGDAHAVGRILALAGWQKRVVRRDGRLMKRWVRPDVSEIAAL